MANQKKVQIMDYGQTSRGVFFYLPSSAVKKGTPDSRFTF